MTFDISTVGEEFVWEVAVEKDAGMGEGTKEGYARRQLIYEIDVVGWCTRPEEMCGEVELACMGKENM